MFEILLILDLDFAKGLEEGGEEGSDLDLPGNKFLLSYHFFLKIYKNCLFFILTFLHDYQ